MADQNQTPSPRRYTKTYGQSGTLIMGGRLLSEEYNNRLKGKQGLKMFDIMRKSEESVRAALQMVKLPLLGQQNTFEAVDDSDKAKFRADFLEREFFKRNVDFHKMKREALTFADFGHSVAEFTLEVTEFQGKKMWGIKSIEFRKQTSIEKWEQQDGTPGITQLLAVPIDGKTFASIPRSNLTVWTNDQEGDNYAGVSLLRYAFKSWDMADKLALVHAIGLEKMAIPTPVLGVPVGAQPDDIDEAIQSIMEYRSNEKAYIKKPAGWDLDAFDLSSQSIDQLLPALQHYEQKILLSVLGQFLMLGATSGGSGSRAVSQDHSELFMLSEESFSKTFLSALQRDLINLLEDINFSDINGEYTELKASEIKKDDVTILSGAVQAFKNAGLFTPTFETEQWVRQIVKAPQLTDDYKADFDKLRDQRLNPPDPIAPGGLNQPAKTDPKKTKKAEAIRSMKSAQKQYMDMILEVE
jgi:hypothetical protein